MSSWCVWVLIAAFAARNQVLNAETEVDDSSPSITIREEKPHTTTALLLGLQDGPTGAEHLQEWVTFVQTRTEELPPVWVFCHENSQNSALVEDLPPEFRSFIVEENTPWETVLENFMLQTTPATVFGLVGEGVLPAADLVQSIADVEQALAGSSAPTAVIPRSRTKSQAGTPPQWLPDTFIAQIWCNSLMMTNVGSLDETVDTSALRGFLPKLIGPDKRKVDAGAIVLVDGTRLVPSVFGSEVSAGNAAVGADGEQFGIGTLESALLRSEDGAVSIGTAPWPPLYVLEHVATEEGIVIVNTVNCGYLDFATNFLRSVTKVVDGVKVLWVATDEVAFDFLDAAYPGTVAMFLSPDSARQEAVGAGAFGDATFASQVLIRPGILLHILNQGFTVLWTDSDMIWMDNPLPLLPDVHDPEAAELFVQRDGFDANVCTCFLFMRPTPMIKQLLAMWIQNIVDSVAQQDQSAFQKPVREAESEGLRVDYFPGDRFPSGHEFFANPYEENYAQIYFPDLVIVHNNFILGHPRKKQRFQIYHLWDVGDTLFPSC